MNDHGHPHDSSGDIKVAFFLNLAFTVLEIVGGLLTNSVAILSDALHDLGDSFSLGLSWFLNRYAEQEGDKHFSYGYRRFSLLGALLNAVILVAGGVFVLSKAVPRLLEPQQAYAPGMALMAVVGIAVNGLAVLRLRGGQSLNVRTVAWHLLEDVLGWVAVLVVSIVLLFADVPILDPILSILITLYVLYHVVNRLRQTAALFLQAVPETVDITYIEDQLLEIEGVLSAHHTHVWSLDGEHHVLTTHIVVDEDAMKADIMEVKCRVRALLDGTNFAHVTVEAEYADEACGMRGRLTPAGDRQP